MADKTTIARPYARAAFEEARGQNRLGPWSEAVHAAAAVVTDPRVETLLGNPRVTADELAQLVIDITGPQLGDEAVQEVEHVRRRRGPGAVRPYRHSSTSRRVRCQPGTAWSALSS